MRRLEKSKVNKKAHDETLCRFTPDASDEPEILTNIGLSDEGQHNLRGSSDALDFGPYMDQTPITVHPRLYLETVMDMFKQLGYNQTFSHIFTFCTQLCFILGLELFSWRKEGN